MHDYYSNLLKIMRKDRTRDTDFLCGKTCKKPPVSIDDLQYNERVATQGIQ